MSKTVHVTEEQPTPAASLSSAEVEQRAGDHIARIRNELASLRAQREAADVAVHQAEQAVEQSRANVSALARAAASGTGQIAAARARVLVSEGTPAAAQAQQQLATLQAEQERHEAAHAAASRQFHARVAALAEARGALASAETTLASAETELQALLDALEAERATAHHEAGLELLTQTRHAFAEAEQQLAAAEAQVAAAQARIAYLRENAARLAAEHPALSESLADLLPQRETSATRLLRAHIRQLQAFAIEAGQGVPMAGSLSVPSIIGEWTSLQYSNVLSERGGASILAQRVRQVEQLLEAAKRAAR